jgi:hypothetical protein
VFTTKDQKPILSLLYEYNTSGAILQIQLCNINLTVNGYGMEVVHSMVHLIGRWHIAG